MNKRTISVIVAVLALLLPVLPGLSGGRLGLQPASANPVNPTDPTDCGTIPDWPRTNDTTESENEASNERLNEAQREQTITREQYDARVAEFKKVRTQYWKDKAVSNPDGYSKTELAQMKDFGSAPDGPDGNPIELHHKKPLASGGLNDLANLIEITQTQHRLEGNQNINHPGAGCPGIFPGTQEAPNCVAMYAVSAPQDPTKATALEMNFGDGTARVVAIPLGTGFFSVDFVHVFRYSEAPVTYEQVATILSTWKHSQSTTVVSCGERAPVINPATQAAEAAIGYWTVGAPMASTPTTLRFCFGDSTCAPDQTIPAGSDGTIFSYSHTFSGTGTYAQTATIVETGAFAKAVTVAGGGGVGTPGVGVPAGGGGRDENPDQIAIHARASGTKGDSCPGGFAVAGTEIGAVPTPGSGNRGFDPSMGEIVR